jgi:hypothetical protein
MAFIKIGINIENLFSGRFFSKTAPKSVFRALFQNWRPNLFSGHCFKIGAKISTQGVFF